MRARLTGTGPAGGLPVPGCGCRVCRSGVRRQAALLLPDGTELGPGPAVRQGSLLWAPDGQPDAAAGPGLETVVLGGPPREAARALARLRSAGALAAGADVVLLTAAHDVPALDPRLPRAWGARVAADGDVLGTAPPLPPPPRTLVLGGSASGKSGLAEDLLAAEPEVVYLATGPVPGPDDAEWAARVAAHRDRRPARWTTLEQPDAAGALAAEDRPVLLDAVGSWLTGVLDRAGAWHDAPGWRKELDAAADALVAAWRARPGRLVAVSDETGWGVVPPTPAGRLFRTELGRLNQRLAAESEQVLLVVAGRVLEL